MPLYIIIDAATRRQLRLATDNILTVNPAREDGIVEALVVDATRDTEPDADAWEWNTDFDPPTYVRRVPVPDEPEAIARTRLSPREFWNRIGQETRVAINMIIAGAVEGYTAQHRAMLLDLKETLALVTGVDLEHPDTQAGVAGLVALGLKTQEESAVILTPSTVAEE